MGGHGLAGATAPRSCNIDTVVNDHRNWPACKPSGDTSFATGDSGRDRKHYELDTCRFLVTILIDVLGYSSGFVDQILSELRIDWNGYSPLKARERRIT